MANPDPHSPFRIEDPQPIEDDNYDGPDYTGLGAEGMGAAASGILRRYGLLIGLVILGICVLLVLLVAFPKKPPLDTTRLEALQARIDQLQERLIQLEAGYTELVQFKTQGERAEQLLGRMDQLESTTAQRMEELSEKLIAVEKLAQTPPAPKAAPPATHSPPPKKKAAQTPPKKAAQPAAAAPEPKKPPATETQIQYHTVQAGETLYRISRKYGISVETLTRLNKISGTDIQPGQRLRVSP
ncbi:MAG: LysM peptidoglycan-binding domain-containing protein [Desulfobacterales bacterium]